MYNNILSIIILSIFVLCFKQDSLADNMETKADKISIMKNEHKIQLDGNVEITISYDDDQKYIFKAQSIDIFYDNDDDILENMSKPKKIVAKGNVVFKTRDLSIISLECVFDDMKSITFDKNVVINDKKLGNINADRASYSIPSKKIDITSKSRVHLTIDDIKHIENKILHKKHEKN